MFRLPGTVRDLPESLSGKYPNACPRFTEIRVREFAKPAIVEGTRLGSDVKIALDDYALPVCDSTIAQRQVYPQTAAEGLTVFDADNAKATAETTALTDEILALLASAAREVA